MRLLTVLFLVIGICGPTHAMTASEKANLAFIRQAADNTDPAVIEALKSAVFQLASQPEIGFQKMATNERVTTILTCAIGKLAAFFKGQVGACVDDEANVYALVGGGKGVSAGVSGSVVLGYVRRSYDVSVRGTYDLRNASLTFFENAKAGIGAEVLYGEATDKKLILVGPSIGWMVDFSVGKIVLD